MNDSKLMNRAADNIRILAASMVEKANSGHPGGAMGGADFVNVLFSEFLVYDPQNPRWEGRDRFFLDPGHMSPMLYSVLAFTGKYTLDELKQFRQWGSPTPGHPEVNVDRGVENTSGPLGQGHTYAVGAAIAAKFLKARFGEVMNQTIYAYISDGGIQEEISQGAGRIAGTLGLDNLIMFYDSNDVQLSTNTEDVTTENVAMKYEAWDWKVITINGNDPDEIRKALTEAKAEKNRPTLIIGKTTMGKGARRADGSSYEADCATHGAPLGGDAYVNTIKNLGGNPENPFTIFPEVAELYAKRAEELKKIVADKYAAKAEWAKANPEKAAKLAEFFSGKAPKVNWDAIEQKAKEIFIASVHQMSVLVADQLYERYQYQRTALARQFPFMMGNNVWKGGGELNPNEQVGDALRSGTLGIGFIGGHNAMVALYGQGHGHNQKAWDTLYEAVMEMNKVVNEYKEKYNLNYSVLATPAEGLSGRFTKMDRRKYGKIPGVTDRDYYVNSFHVDVKEPISIVEKIKREAPFHAITRGGHITYVELDGEAQKNVRAIAKIVKVMHDEGIGYGSINHPVDTCHNCGYKGVIFDKCPVCQSESILRMRRITGYLTGDLSSWNSAKRAEEQDRVKHL